MFSLFQKKTQTYPEESKWSVHEGRNQGRQMLIRRNDSAKQLMGHPNFKYRAGIAITLHNPSPEGLPTKEETDILYGIEDALLAEVERNKAALLVLVITTSGMREFVCYTRNPDMMKQAASILQSKFSSHEIQSYVENDPKWDVYKQF